MGETVCFLPQASSVLSRLHGTKNVKMYWSLYVLYMCLPEQFFSVTVDCLDLFTRMRFKVSYHVFLQIQTQLQHLQYCVTQI
jgi:hypothetical protein